MGELISCLEELYPITDKSRRTVLIEYVMLKGVNDSLADAERLCELLQRVRCKVRPHSSSGCHACLRGGMHPEWPSAMG